MANNLNKKEFVNHVTEEITNGAYSIKSFIYSMQYQ